MFIENVPIRMRRSHEIFVAILAGGNVNLKCQDSM